MYLSDILNLLDIKDNINDFKINKIRIDSRLVNDNDIFITINSGYKYIDDSINRGCKVIITDINYNNDNIYVIKVKDTIKVLGIVAKYIRSKYNGIIIGITGSNGKTTTKELLTYILSTKYKVLYTKGSLNNHIGVPSTLLELDNTYDYVVLELGSNHMGEIKYLSDIAKPNISIITNIGYSHIGNFKNINNTLKEKLSIGGLLFLNGEDKLLKDKNGIKVYLDSYNYICSIKHFTMNYYLVFKVCEYLNLNIDEVISIVSRFNIYNSRMNIINYNNIILIDDTYNASYESVINGIDSLNKYNNKLIILGDMLELGSKKYYLYKNLNKYISNINNIYLITLGNNRLLDSNIHFKDIYDLNKYICNINYNDYDVIYIKGAHKMNLISTVNIIKSILQNK